MTDNTERSGDAGTGSREHEGDMSTDRCEIGQVRSELHRQQDAHRSHQRNKDS